LVQGSAQAIWGNTERGPVDLAPSKGGLYTKEGTNREHGNSYLALVEYVGLLGILPFALLVFLVMRMIFQVCAWMRETSNPYHCAIPLAMVLLSGLVHAFFEDWLTAVGYYLCLFFWTLAFLLRDMMPAASPLRIPGHWRILGFCPSRRNDSSQPMIPIRKSWRRLEVSHVRSQHCAAARRQTRRSRDAVGALGAKTRVESRQRC
jgi:hypothetical protein